MAYINNKFNCSLCVVLSLTLDVGITDNSRRASVMLSDNKIILTLCCLLMGSALSQ